MQVSATLKQAQISAAEGPPGGRPDARPAGGEGAQPAAFSQKKAAGIVRKVLESAIANAEHNEGADIDELKIAAIFVNEGRTLKRFHARAKGRGNRIFKRSSHITVTVGD